ncbi:MAG: CbtA family protein [Halohasta sp.]
MYRYLKGGVLAGGVAGVAYGLFLATIATPLTEHLHAVSHDHGHDHGHAAGEAATLVTESTTALVSVGGGLLWAIFLGGLFGLALFVLEPALPGTERVKAHVLAGCGFLTISAIPWLVMPPATPSSEHLYGIDTRLAIYGGLVLVGAIVAASAVGLYTRTAGRHRLLRVLSAGIPLGAAVVVLPTITPTIVSHPGVRTDLVVAYQAMVVVGQAGIWLLIASAFNWLRGRGGSTPAAGSTDRAPESA